MTIENYNSLKKKFQRHLRCPTILCFSITITGRCNACCSYCHFYGMRDKKIIRTIWKDIDDAVFKLYIKFLKRIKTLLPDNVDLQYRFSGGEPLIVGDRIFELADYGYKETGITPYILTNGLAITKEWIGKAKKHHIKHLFVSLEDPFNPDLGAPNPNRIIDKINRFTSPKLPIIPGVAIIKNENFKSLYNICKFFYKKLGAIPTISELNFQTFGLPSKQEYKDLYKNVFKIVKEFSKKTQLILFPYISPELSYGGAKQYLLELDINNRKYRFTHNNIDEKIELVFNHLERSYPRFYCREKNCDWFEFCQNYKWVWDTTFNRITLQEKQRSYCNLKKTINNAFCDALEGFR